MKKKLLSLVLATTMVAGLTACGAEKAPEQSQEPVASTTTEEKVEDSAEAPAETKTVDLLVWSPSEDAHLGRKVSFLVLEYKLLL